MAQGIALTIGLNEVDPQHYAGWSGKLMACEADAIAMAEVARSKEFAVETLYTKDATREKVIGNITKATEVLKSGDIFFLTYSGHGGQLPDLSNDEEEDRLDETWCLYDGQLVDDEIYDLLGKFQSGVRILVFSDSCHSGSAIKAAYYEARVRQLSLGGIPQEVRYRNMPREQVAATYYANKKFYDEILLHPKLREAVDEVQASALLISGCQDSQLSADGIFNGRFTGTLLEVWNGGKFKGDYRRFHRVIKNQMPPDQTPNYYRVGKIDPNFESQIPFTI
jgi:hypothetical protein